MKTTPLKHRGLLLAAALCIGTPLLQGCLPAVAVGVTAGALAVSDRRALTTQAVDEEIEVKAELRIREKFGDKVHINITSYNRKVLLTGEATTEALKAEVAALVQALPNVAAIYNEIAYAGTASLTARSNDSYITTKVKARFIEADKFRPQHVKVVTESGVVYLLGLATERETRDAVDIARTTSGVRKVVNVIETIGEEQANALDNKPAGSSPR